MLICRCKVASIKMARKRFKSGRVGQYNMVSCLMNNLAKFNKLHRVIGTRGGRGSAVRPFLAMAWPTVTQARLPNARARGKNGRVRVYKVCLHSQ